MTFRLAATLAATLFATCAAFAHGDEHHRCKKGYVMTDSHTCVKAPK